MKIIERPTYINRLNDVMNTPDIKVITGLRRSGKSKLMEAFCSHILEYDMDANIIHVNFNLPNAEPLSEYHKLYNYVNNLYIEGKNNYLLLDEIQMCHGFEKAINWLYSSERFDIYITGSNAFLLSSDLATLFTGRTFEITVYPFSFEEFVRYYDYTDLQLAFDHYVKEGGMSGSYLYKNEADRYAYISDVFRTLIVRDLRQKYHLRNMSVLERLTDYLMDNISNITSLRNIADGISKSGLKTNDKTIGAYVSYLCNAFAFHRIRRFDIRGKRYLASQDKFYIADHSFRYAILGTKNMDYGRVYENIVAIELLRRGYELYVGYMYQKEIDFIATRQNEKLYIQVSDDISNEDTFRRETEPLMKIRDAYPRILIARTRHEEYTYEGLRIIDIAQWLINI